NFACERARFQEEFYISNEIIQPYPTMKINSDLIKYKDGYHYPYEILHKDLIGFTGEDIVSCEAVDLVVKLDLGEHSAWRKIVTPSDITFKQLHQILQLAFQWNDYHLYDFNIMDTRGNITLNIVSEYEEIYDITDSSVKFDGE